MAVMWVVCGKHKLTFFLDGGNGLVDEALITNGYMPLYLYGQAFEAQYGRKPGNFAGLHQLLQDTLNCEATIGAVIATVASESYRRTARDLILNIKAEFEKVQTGCEPLIDLKQEVIRLKQTKWRIIDVDRRYRGRRGLMVSKTSQVIKLASNIYSLRPNLKIQISMPRMQASWEISTSKRNLSVSMRTKKMGLPGTRMFRNWTVNQRRLSVHRHK